MPVEVVMPKLGLTMATGTIARWMKRAGDTVKAGEPLLEVATDKINYEVEAPGSGTLANVVGAEGGEYACGDVLALIAASGEMDSLQADSAMANAVVEAPLVSAAAGTNGTQAPETSPKPVVVSLPVVSQSNDGPRTHAGRTVASPAARRLARERGVHLAEVRGTGPRGRITLTDIPAAPVVRQAHHDNGGAFVPQELPPQLPAKRRAIFRKMTEVARIPLARVEHRARCERVRALMTARGDFGWAAFAIFAAARLLREHSDLRTDATTGAPFERIDIGFAADTPHGLIVPVVRGADGLQLAAIHAEIGRMAADARGGKLAPADMGGACFAISNVGPTGVERVVPLPDPPQTAILGVGAVVQRPVVENDAVVPGWVCELVVSFDHRFIDGAPAARFLAALARAYEAPGFLL